MNYLKFEKMDVTLPEIPKNFIDSHISTEVLVVFFYGTLIFIAS
jgi:hypothetical protein